MKWDKRMGTDDQTPQCFKEDRTRVAFYNHLNSLSHPTPQGVTEHLSGVTTLVQKVIFYPKVLVHMFRLTFKNEIVSRELPQDLADNT